MPRKRAKNVSRPASLEHYTLTTGHTRKSFRSEVRNEALEVLSPFLSSGRLPLPPPFHNYECQVTTEGDGLMATVWEQDRPIVTFGVAPNERVAGIVWEALENGYTGALFQATPPCRPKTVPWCGVIIMFFDPDEGWVADFERCLAWAWIERANARLSP
jgi:hypothetical protein